jgi:tol-pal system protein YbgF
MHRYAALALAALGLLTTACASSPFTADTPNTDQMQALEQRVVDLQKKAAMDEVEIDHLRQRIAELEAHTGLNAPRSATAPATPRTGPPPKPSPPPAEPVYREQPAPIEERDLDVSQQPPAALRPGAPKSPSSTTPMTGPGGSPAPEPMTPAIQALYDRGYTLYHQGHYIDAETSFQRFIQAHPTNELADNAQYWIGECRYSRGDYRGALAAFRETVARFPEGSKVPDALLKAGESLEKLGDREGARGMYQEVIRRFPQSAVASVAEDRQSKLP